MADLFVRQPISRLEQDDPWDPVLLGDPLAIPEEPPIETCSSCERPIAVDGHCGCS